MRFCWALVLQPGAVRVCLLESDAIHVSAEMDLATVDGRRALANLYAGMCVSEPWRLGADPTMAWRSELGRWEIACGDEVGGVRSYFGRATRCFRVSLEPQGKLDHVLKDSWQLAPSGAADRRPPDEIDVLRTIRIKLEAAQSDVTYPRLVCGGTVHIATVDDSDMTDTSALILGPFAQYSRWTVPHGHHGDRRQFHREHRRMVTTPIGLPIARLDKEHEVVAVLADAMRAHTEISRRCGILHRDISLNNILAVRLPGGRLRGMLIDYDHAIEAAAASNTARPGHVGTGPFMSIANLEGLHVPRTAADDWESLLCLLFCLAARREQSLEDMARDFMHVSRRGVAELKRHVFASPARLESAIRRYLDPGFAHVVRLIRALYTAIFQHPQCHGTAQIGLSSTRTIDPIKRRAMYAGEIQIRCMRAMEAAAADIANIQALHEHLAGTPQPQPPATSLCSQSTAQSTAESMASTLPPPPQSLSLADKPPVKDIARAIMHMNMRRNKRKADVSGCYQQSPKQKRRRLSTFSDVSMQSAIREDDEWPSPSLGKRSRAMRDLPEDPESPCPSKRLCFE
ncbi:hypothetical protein DL89DRAFT_266804 [Linderina pennispora]|uniref:Fungal-type protein kinase domain-containing protein n=1 Tax=Linderina pennispora TaxID=61395 RepID=A0A1Y1WAZ6_9FUNG|nr:uncharacterized protein DL89DRAFT_266804 [Linderina pennispora]ORX70612.1 hypothetical protein DL89DRAFT_266804 [Linderina pennispora]